jgi:hypothetical protein
MCSGINVYIQTYMHKCLHTYAVLCEILDFHGGDDYDDVLLGLVAVWTGLGERLGQRLGEPCCLRLRHCA